MGDRWGEEITAAAYGGDHFRAFGIRLDLPPQAAHLDVDGSVERCSTPAVRQVQQLVAAQHLLRVLRKRGEELELGRAEVDDEAIRRPQATPGQVQSPSLENKDPGPLALRGRGAARAPQHGSNTGKQLARSKRVPYMTMGSAVQPGYDGSVFFPGAEGTLVKLTPSPRKR